MENKIETKHHEPIVYRIYDYLRNNHLGRKNGIPKTQVAEKFGISSRDLRKITQQINTSNELEKLVSTTHCCYMCDTREECEQSIRNTYRTAITLLKKGKTMEKKAKLNGQLKIKLGTYFNDFVETFTSEE